MTEGHFTATNDEELTKQLYQLLVIESRPEVEIIHPEEGHQVVTRADFDAMQKRLAKSRGLSPAQRLQENSRVERAMQMRFRTAMLDADIREVDIQGEDNFGYDVKGNKIDIDGMTFVPVDQYINGIELRPGEIGSFVSANMTKPPIRIIAR